MFGVPFGPEIDIWSLGCIVAELYIGKPLFLGGNRTKVLQEVTSILGPIPRSPFHTGKYFEDLSQFIGHHKSEDNHLKCVSNVMLKLHNSRNFSFARFLVGLLKYKPDAGSCADISFPTEYNFKPYVDEEVKRQHFSGTELLKKGTTVTASSSKHFQSKQENATSLRTGNLHCSQREKVTINEKSRQEDQLLLENFSYAMEGPLATGYPKSIHQQNETCAVFKGNTCTDDIEEERKQVSDRLMSTLLTPTNLSLGKFSEKKKKSVMRRIICQQELILLVLLMSSKDLRRDSCTTKAPVLSAKVMFLTTLM
ncbi:unnamed protein product [Pocillopora meandrina]|uniref:Protein kinase domain-containing protein n=1 Tax=Pocillopora meandrina TaxID=46732 RepID=A0AAU9Y4L0_9CNID|nr:unnamed protein product [Pocillopora meandrina]